MREHNMFPISSVLVGLSGGADSAALLSVLNILGKNRNFTVYAAHINHMLRGEAADRDEAHCKALCEEYGIKLFTLRANVRELAKERGISEELAGRYVRYEFFDKLAEKYGIDKIATAHHKNDNAETIVMNFARGTSLRGLCGIPYTRGRIIRPFLDINRNEIEQYCAASGIKYVTDETNLETAYTRNKARHLLIPLIEEQFNPSFTDTLISNARIIAAEEDYISSEADKAYNETVKNGAADIASLLNLHRAIALRVIRKMIGGVCGTEDIAAAAAESVLKLAGRGNTGSRCDIKRGAYAELEYGKLIIKAQEDIAAEFLYKIVPGEEIYIPETGYTLRAEYCTERLRDNAEYFSIPNMGAELVLRSRREGDRFRPRGLSGTKKVKDFMIDRKLPRSERGRVGILTIGGDIAWIVGYRRDGRFDFDGKGIKIFVSY